MVTPYDVSVRLAEKLNELAPGPSKKKSIFVTTGAEAVENAVKIARAHTGRRGVIAFNGGFHGRTMLAMGLTGKITPYKNLFGPFPAEIYHAPFPIDYHGVSVEAALRAVDDLFKVDLAPTDCAAIIVEPVQGEGGFYPAPIEFLQALRKLCDEHGIVLIVDEIQTGFGRTGCWFACEEAGIVPDIITLGKGIAGGVPMGAVGWHGDLGQIPTGSHGSTFGGNPLAAAAAIATITTLRDEDLSGRAAEVGGWFLDELRALDLRAIREIRGRGLMIGIELRGRVTPLLKALHERGIIALPAGTTVLRLLPPLTISRDDLRRVLTALEEVLS